jgi:hypothetical protein
MKTNSMTNALHQQPDKSRLICLPLNDKLDAIQRIYIRHPDIDHAWKVLKYNLLHSVRRSEAACGYIVGHSRCGKSETAKRWIYQTCGRRPEAGKPGKPYQPYQLIEGNGKTIVYADLTNGSTPFIATCQMLKKLFNDITTTTLSETTAAARLIEQFRLAKVDQFIIDEGQKMFVKKGAAAITKFASWLVTIENARLFGTVVMGDMRLKDLFPQDDAINERKTGLALLRPFPFATPSDEEDYEGFVVEFERMLPFNKTPITNGTGRCTPLMLLMIYFATRGPPGALSKLCEAATVEAYERLGGKNVESLEMADFIAAFDFLSKNDPRMKGVNPFTVDDRRKIPSFPLTPTEKEADSEADTPEAPRRRSKVGGRILAKS